MKNIFIILLFSVICFDGSSQNNIQNSQKYWYYRKRLKEKFIQYDANDGYGSNNPVSSISTNGTTVDWGDGNGSLPYYISLLATEYRLLKNNGIDYTATRDELFHALMAFERLDYVAETWFRDCNTGNGAASLNGFFIRFELVGINGKKFFQPCPSQIQANEESKDNVWHLLLGLALVKALVDDNTSYYSRFEGKTTTIPEMAKGIAYRVVSFMHGEAWTSGPCISIGESCHAKWMNGKCFYDAWVIRNPITFNQVGDCVHPGSNTGVIDEIPTALKIYAGVCGFQFGLAEAANWITGENLHYDGSQNDGSCFNNAANYCINNTNILDMDYYSYGALYAVMGNHTDYLISAKNNTLKYYYPHFVLIDYVLHGNNIKIEHPEFINEFQNLLNSAPDCGPSNDYGNYRALDWSTSNSLVWPEDKGKNPHGSYYYSGIDYMLLYNLFWLTYGDCIYNNSSYSTTYSDVFSNVFNYDIVSLNTPAISPIVKANKAIFLNAGFTTNFVSTFSASVRTSGFSDSKISYSKIDNPPSNSCPESSLRYAVTTVEDELESDTYYTNEITENKSIKNDELQNETLEINSEHETYIYPNPTDGKINIDLGKNCNFKINIINTIGHTIYSNSFEGENIVSIDISSFESGIYFLRFTKNESTNTIKIIKK
jgi:hypothetical protein